MQVNVVSSTGDGGSVNLADRTFSAEFNEALVHQVVSAYMARGRSGTKSRRSRAEVRGGGTKPWRQKGLGRGAGWQYPKPNMAWRRCGVCGQAS